MKQLFKDKSLWAIVLYIIGYFLLNIALLGLIRWSPSFLITVLSIFKSLPQVYIFFLLFLIQEFIILFIMYLCFSLINGGFKNLVSYISRYYKDLFVWKGFVPFLKYSIGLFFVYGFVISILNYLLTRYNINVPGLFGKQNVAEMLSNIQVNNGNGYILLIVLVSILGPIVEEIIYRGFITNLLIKRFGSLIGIVGGAFIFTLVHMEWQVFGNLFILSIFLSYIFYKTRSLYYTFGFHFIINFIAILVLLASKLTHLNT